MPTVIATASFSESVGTGSAPTPALPLIIFIIPPCALPRAEGTVRRTPRGTAAAGRLKSRRCPRDGRRRGRRSLLGRGLRRDGPEVDPLPVHHLRLLGLPVAHVEVVRDDARARL